MIIRIDSLAHLSPLSQPPGALITQIKAWLTFNNPAFLEKERRGFSNWDTPREIRGYEAEADDLVLPQGTARHMVSMIRQAGPHCQIVIGP